MVDYLPEVGNSSGEDKGNRPVDWNHADPDELARLASEVGKTEKLLEDVLVKHLDSDIAVECSSDQRSNKVEDVTSLQCSQRGNALVGRIDGILTLESINVDAEEEVDNIDEGVSYDESLPEVPGLAHFGHELAEKHGSTVRIDCLHEADDLTAERNVGGRSSISHDGWWRRPDVGAICGHGSIVVRDRVRDGCDGNDHNDDVDPDGSVCDPTKTLESTNLPKEHTKNCPDDTADDVADVAVDLVKTLSVTDDNNTNVEEQLDGLQNVECMASVGAVDAESDVSVGLQRVSMRVEGEEHVPDLPTSVTCESTKDCVEDNTRAVTHFWQDAVSIGVPPGFQFR